MFEITQPTSNSSTQSRSLTTGTNPPKSDSGVIRGRPEILSYTLELDISNQTNPSWSLDLNIQLFKLTPSEGSPALNILNSSTNIGFLGPNAQQDVSFALVATNPSDLPPQGAVYTASGIIQFYEEGNPNQQTHIFQVPVSVEIVE
ncbi:MAG: hypothetical protein R8P61_23890 [Bacteroidia bacterium]|nr:hypothetical protein [Bacteroidia bacterium]